MGLIKMNGVDYWGSAYGQGIIAPMIYSEEEIEIGVWTDGKPLYQRTWILNSPLSCATNTWVDTPIPNVGMQRIVKGFANDIFDNGGVSQSNSFLYLSFAVNAPTYVRILNARPTTITVNAITLQYTKTTDTAGSGTYTPSKALAVHYSTNEQVIGTWIDGKPLYERVVQINSLPADTNTTAYPHGISDIDTICDYDFIIHWSNGNTAKADRIQMFSGAFQANGAIAVFVNDTNISVSCGQDRSALSGDCIIRYTKTTDV